MSTTLTKDKVQRMIVSGLENPYFVNHLATKYALEKDVILEMGKRYAGYISERLDRYEFKPMFEVIDGFRVPDVTSEKLKELLHDLDTLVYKERKKIKDYRGFHRFRNRSDGRRLMEINPFMKVFPYIMKQRNDAQIFAKYEWDAELLDEYIKEKRREGMSLSYLHVFIALFVRVMAKRPALNRFIMANRVYARNDISVTFSIMKSLRDGGEETSLKFHFTGNENIYDIYYEVEKAIQESLVDRESTEVDKILDKYMSLPSPVISLAANFVRLLDRWNMVPRDLLRESPFHSSLFLTYLKSIKLNYVYHHIYNFGSTSLFISIGKEKRMPVAVKDKIKIKKMCQLGITIDERICEGLYLAHTLRVAKKHTANLHLLDRRLREVVEDVN